VSDFRGMGQLCGRIHDGGIPCCSSVTDRSLRYVTLLGHRLDAVLFLFLFINTVFMPRKMQINSSQLLSAAIRRVSVKLHLNGRVDKRSRPFVRSDGV